MLLFRKMQPSLVCGLLLTSVAAFQRIQFCRYSAQTFTRFSGNGNANKEPSLLKEELGELTVGIKEFQTDAFKQLYNKTLSWSAGTSLLKKNQVQSKPEVMISSPVEPDSIEDAALSPPASLQKQSQQPITSSDLVVNAKTPFAAEGETFSVATEVDVARLNSMPDARVVEDTVTTTRKESPPSATEPLKGVSSNTKRAPPKAKPAFASKPFGGLLSFLDPSPGFDKPPASVASSSAPAPNKLKEALFFAPSAAPPKPRPNASTMVAPEVPMATIKPTEDADYKPPVVKVMRPAQSKAPVSQPKSQPVGSNISSMFGFLTPKPAPAPPAARTTSEGKATVSNVPAAPADAPKGAPAKPVVYNPQPSVIRSESDDSASTRAVARLNSIPIVQPASQKVNALRLGEARPAAEPLFDSVFSMFKSFSALQNKPSVGGPADTASTTKVPPKPPVTAVTEVPAPVATKQADEAYRPPVVKVLSEEPESTLGSVFGLLKPKSAPAAPQVTPARPISTATKPAGPSPTATPSKPPIAPVASPALRQTGATRKAPASAGAPEGNGGGSMFGAIGSMFGAKTVTTPVASPVPAQSRAAAVAVNKPAVVTPRSTPPQSSAPATLKTAPPSSNPAKGFFSFLQTAPSTVTMPKKQVSVSSAATPAPPKAPQASSMQAFALFSKQKPAAVIPQGKIAVVKPSPTTPPAPGPVTKGLLNFGLPSFGSVKTAASLTPLAATAPAAGMSEKFRATVSRLLGGDAAKINAVQKSTDSFRSGSITVEAYVSKLAQLFGDNLPDTIVQPLVSEIPERDLAQKLDAAFRKFQQARQTKERSATQKSNPFSFSFLSGNSGGGAVTSFAAPKQSAVPTSITTKLTQSPRAGAGTGPQVPDQVPIAKKPYVESQLKAVLSGSVDVKTFYDGLVRELGRTKVKVILPALQAQLSREKASQLVAVDAAAK